jgi:NitT/TauT family transport system substrate-binding protein
MSPKKVTVAYPSYGPSMLWLLLEKDLGFFRSEGLNTEFILVRGGSVAVKGLIGGNFSYVTPPGSALDAVILGGQPLRIVFTAGTIHNWFVARPEISSIADLKGKAIAVTSLGSLADFTVREILKRHGLDPRKDITLLSVGSSRERFAALTSGTVQATLLSPPFHLKALQMGYRLLAKTGDYVKLPQGGLATSERKIIQDPLEVTKMVRASMKGLRFILNQQEFVVAKIIQMFGLSREEAVQTYGALREEYLPSGHLPEEVERTIISMRKQAANVTEDISPERVFDNRFVKQVEKELQGWTPQIPR